MWWILKKFIKFCQKSEMHLEPSQTSKIKAFCEIVNDLTISAKSLILDVWLGSEYGSES